MLIRIKRLKNATKTTNCLATGVPPNALKTMNSGARKGSCNWHTLPATFLTTSMSVGIFERHFQHLRNGHQRAGILNVPEGAELRGAYLSLKLGHFPSLGDMVKADLASRSANSREESFSRISERKIVYC